MPKMYMTGLVPYDYEQVTVSATAVGLNATKYKVPIVLGAGGNPTGGAIRYADYALAVVEAQPIRYRFEGTPTSSLGNLGSDKDKVEIEGLGSIVGFRMIRQGATNATVNVTYFRRE